MIAIEVLGNLVRVSGGLGDILDRIVRKDYRQRFISAVEVLPVLDGFSGQVMSPTVPSHPPSSTAVTCVMPKFELKKVQEWIKDANITMGICGSVAALVTLGPVLIWLENLPRNYANSEGLTLEYPGNWKKVDLQNPIAGNGVAFMSPKEGEGDKFQESVSLHVVSSPLSLDEYYGKLRQEIEDKSQQKLPRQPHKTKLGYRDAYSVVSKVKEGDVEVKRTDIWTVKNGKVYVLTYRQEVKGTSNYEPVFEKIKNSVNIE